MNKRLAMLEQLVASGKADAFARYALAMEYRKESRFEEALSAFRALRELDPEYLALYLMAGQLLIEHDRGADAVEWLEQGLEVARRRGDQKALSELQAALDEVT